MPLALSEGNNGLFLLTNERLIYLEDGQEVRASQFPDLQKIRFGEDVLAIVQSEMSIGVSYRVRAFDSEGQELLSEKFSTQILDLEVFEDRVYILSHTSLYVLKEGEKMQEYPLKSECSDIGVFAEDTVILCSDSSATIQILK
jgi:hypothetical protein